MCPPFERHHLEVPDRLDGDHVVRQRVAAVGEAGAGPRMNGKDDGKVDREAGENASEAVAIVDVLGAMQRQQDVAIVLARGNGQARVRVQRGPRVRLHHDVAHELGAVAQPFVREVAHRGLGRRQQHVGQVVGDDAVPLLRHAPVERAQSRLHVRQPRAAAIGERELGGEDGRGQRRVRVAVDQHAIGRVLEHDGLQSDQHVAGHGPVGAAADLEVDVGLGDLQVAEERRAHGIVVVLPGVDQDFGVGAAQRSADRRGLDELGPRSDDGQDPHADSSGGNAVPQRGHGPRKGLPSGSSRKGSPHEQALPSRRAGLPATSS